jgi:hypothetical protein
LRWCNPIETVSSLTSEYNGWPEVKRYSRQILTATGSFVVLALKILLSSPSTCFDRGISCPSALVAGYSTLMAESGFVKFVSVCKFSVKSHRLRI